MPTKTIVPRAIDSIRAHSCRRLLVALWAGVAIFAAYGVSPAHARMGNTPELLGSVQADVDKIIMACLLGGACATPEGVIYRVFPLGTATLIWRGELTIEDKDNIPGIGFGSLRSLKNGAAFTDVLTWSGLRTKNPGNKLSASVSESIRIFEGSGASKGCPTVIKTAGSCQALPELGQGAPSQFDYLIEIDLNRFGESDAVLVKRCRSGIRVQCSSTVLESGVTIDAHRSLGGYDLSSIGTKRYP